MQALYFQILEGKLENCVSLKKKLNMDRDYLWYQQPRNETNHTVVFLISCSVLGFPLSPCYGISPVPPQRYIQLRRSPQAASHTESQTGTDLATSQHIWKYQLRVFVLLLRDAYILGAAWSLVDGPTNLWSLSTANLFYRPVAFSHSLVVRLLLERDWTLLLKRLFAFLLVQMGINFVHALMKSVLSTFDGGNRSWHSR